MLIDRLSDHVPRLHSPTLASDATTPVTAPRPRVTLSRLASSATLLALVTKISMQQQQQRAAANPPHLPHLHGFGSGASSFADKLGAEVAHLQKAAASSNFIASWAKGLLQGKKAGGGGGGGSSGLPAADDGSGGGRGAVNAYHLMGPPAPVPVPVVVATPAEGAVAGVGEERKDGGEAAPSLLPTSTQAEMPPLRNHCNSGTVPPSPAVVAASPAAAATASVDVFRRQLALLMLQTYGCLRDAFKKQIAALLPECIQRPPQPSPFVSPAVSPSRAAAAASPSEHRQPSAALSSLQSTLEAPTPPPPSYGNGGDEEDDGWVAAGYDNPVPSVASPGGAADRQHRQRKEEEEAQRSSALRPWAELVALLHDGLVLLGEQGVPRIVIKCLMKQVLGFVNAQASGCCREVTSGVICWSYITG